MTKGVQFPNDAFGTCQATAVNRTTAALAQYGVYQIDFGQTDGDSSDVAHGMGNIVANGSTYNTYSPVCVVGKAGIADNEACLVSVYGRTKAKIESAVTKGGLLKLGSANGFTASTGSDLCFAMALSTSTASQAAGDVFIFAQPIKI